MKRILISSLTMFGLLACNSAGSIDPPPPTDELADCTAGQIEADLASKVPLAGPGVRADGTLAPGHYTLSSTYLQVKTDAAGQARLRELGGPIGQALRSQPGLVAILFASSESCKTERTLSVWKDEAAMYEFVTGPAHSDAVASVGEVSRGGSVVTHWSDDERGASWEKAAQQLGAVTGPFY